MKINKLLLIAAASIMTTNAYAGCGTNSCSTEKVSQVSCATTCYEPTICCEQGNGPYVTAGVGLSWLSNIRHNYKAYTDLTDIAIERGLEPAGTVPEYDNPYSLKLKSKKITPIFQIGGGYRVNENMRAELVLLLAFTKFRGRVPNIVDVTDPSGFSGIGVDVVQKVQIYTLMAKALFDLPFDQLQGVGIYGGPGVGISYVKDKTSRTYFDSADNTFYGSRNYSSRNKISPAFGVFLGANIPIPIDPCNPCNNINLFIEGNYLLLGKSKIIRNSNHTSRGIYRGLGLMAGVRYEF